MDVADVQLLPVQNRVQSNRPFTICTVWDQNGGNYIRRRWKIQRGSVWRLVLWYFTRLSYSIYKHDAIDMAGPSSMQDTSHMNFVIDLTHRRVSLSSEVDHRSAESDDVRFDSSWGLRTLSLSHARDKTKNIFLWMKSDIRGKKFACCHIEVSIFLWVLLASDITQRSTLKQRQPYHYAFSNDRVIF